MNVNIFLGTINVFFFLGLGFYWIGNEPSSPALWAIAMLMNAFAAALNFAFASE